VVTAKTDKHDVLIEGHTLTLTSLDKSLWPLKSIDKKGYLHYLIHIAPYMLPFLENRHLTVIRYPHGAAGKSFYQKNKPAYAPDFIQSDAATGDINYIVCSDLTTLLWLGNQLALELHIPFHTIQSSFPSEIVFDLDPPSREQFNLAIQAARIIKEILDKLQLISFIKTSGNKGLQIYIPLPENTYTFEQTRLFTHFIARYVVELNPFFFTIERLKSKRGHKLYVDYLQHAAGKTIIAPYSTRGHEEALVATPLFWAEVSPSLSPRQFPLTQIPQRISEKGCPFAQFEESKTKQPFDPILQHIQGL
jgi:bifunctional non-homologous end joining protein LigD